VPVLTVDNFLSITPQAADPPRGARVIEHPRSWREPLSCQRNLCPGPLTGITDDTAPERPYRQTCHRKEDSGRQAFLDDHSWWRLISVGSRF
jgi:hypothetical protein